jgi:hypothetical protein
MHKNVFKLLNTMNNMKNLKQLGLAAVMGAGLATTADAQLATMLPANQRVLGFSWAYVPGVSGYNFYSGNESYNYNFKMKNGGPTATNTVITMPNLTGERVFNATTYNSYLESDFGPEVKVNFGPAPTAFLTNYSGVQYYQITETRFVNDNVFRLQSTTQSNRFWGNTVGAFKMSEKQIGTNLNTYLTTWLLPAPLPIATNMYFQPTWVSEYLNTGKKPSGTQITEIY